MKTLQLIVVIVFCLVVNVACCCCGEEAGDTFNDAFKCGWHAEGGKMAMEEGKYQEAVKEFEEALKYDPSDIEAMEGLADAYCKVGRYEDAVQYYEKAISISKDKTRLEEKLEEAKNKL